jgi:hypothetical protein
MLFGNSYKPWDVQAREFFRINPEMIKDVETIEYSNAEWISWGGLKWCAEDIFQNKLNREGCQDHDPDNKTPRKYDKMIFRQDLRLMRKLIKNWKRGNETNKI